VEPIASRRRGPVRTELLTIAILVAPQKKSPGDAGAFRELSKTNQ
jgi:hypothetical protein